MPKKKKIKYKELIPIGPPRLTIFERARIIGVRAVQIDYGALPFIEVDKQMSSIEIAKKELEEGILPLSIKRKLAFKEDYPPIPVKWLVEAEKEDLIVDL